MRNHILWLAAATLAWPACADAQRARIKAVAIDEHLGVMALEIEELAADRAVEVRLDGRPEALVIVSRIPNRIVARLPGGLGWARHVVRVVPTASIDDAGEADFTLGIVGPPVSEH
jgi:hypothetical protein